MNDFNLRALIRDVDETSTLKDPGDIAEEVLRRINEETVWDALRQSLRVFVRQVISENRPHSVTPYSTVTSETTSATPSSAISAPKPFVKSGKVAAIRDGWQRHLRAKYSTEHGWERLGDCSYEDLLFIADDLDRKAAQNQTKARGFRGLAAAMTDHDASRVRDLPASVLMSSLGNAA